MIEVIKLPDEIIKEIDILVNQLKKDIEEDYPNPILREDIFEILSAHCTIIYYPLEQEKNHGFHIKDKMNLVKVGDFVYINTAHTLDKQVFTAAHELGHILEIAEKICKKLKYGFDEEIDDRITNLFAAELIMPHDLFERSYANYVNTFANEESSINIKDFLKVVSMLMNEFLVPYKSVVLRCFECKLIDQPTAQNLVNEYDDDSSMLKKVLERIILEQGHVKLLNSSMKKYIKGLSDVLDKAEKNGKFTNEKIINMRNQFELNAGEKKAIQSSINAIKKNGIKE